MIVGIRYLLSTRMHRGPQLLEGKLFRMDLLGSTVGLRGSAQRFIALGDTFHGKVI